MNAVPRRGLLAISLVALAGCASSLYEGKYEWSEGWRKGEVIKVQTAAEMERPRFYECVRNASPQQLATGTFAVVKYKRMSRTQRRAVPLQPGEKVRVGDAVYVKVDDCTTQLVARTAGARG